MEYRGILGRGRGGMMNMLRMLGAMGSIFGMGMGGAVAASRKGVKYRDSGEMPFTAEEYAKRKKRQKMARMSRRRNRKVA